MTAEAKSWLQAFRGGVQRLTPKANGNLVEQADHARDTRQWQEAALLYKRAVKAHPGDVGLRVQLGHMLKESGAFNEAFEQYRVALDKAPSDADLHLQLGHLFTRQGEGEKAQPWYAKALDLAAEDSSVAQDARRALDELDDLPSYQKRMAALDLVDAQRFSEARLLLQNLVEHEGRNELTGILANVCKELGDFKDAERFYARYEATAVDADTRFDAALQQGHFAKVRQDFTVAIKYFSEAKRLHPEISRQNITLMEIESELCIVLGRITSKITLSIS